MKYQLLTTWITALFIYALPTVSNAGAQQEPAVDSTLVIPLQKSSLDSVLIRNPLKPPDTSSPRTTLHSFLDNMNRCHRILMGAHGLNAATHGFLTPDSVRYMAELAEQYFERSVYCLNLSEVPMAFRRERGYEAALQLKEVLDRIELPPDSLIPDEQAMEMAFLIARRMRRDG